MSTGNEIVMIEKEFSLEAIIKYTTYKDTYKCGRFKGGNDLILMVKKHLSAAGWTFYFQKIKGNRNGLRYESPNGKKFYSLMTACEWYLANVHPDEVAGKSEQAFSNKEDQESIKAKNAIGRPKKGPADQTKKNALELTDVIKAEASPNMNENDVAEGKPEAFTIITNKMPGKPEYVFPKKEENRKPKKGPGRPRKGPAKQTKEIMNKKPGKPVYSFPEEEEYIKPKRGRGRPRKGPANQTKKRKYICMKPTKKKLRSTPFYPPSLMARLIDGNVVLAGAKVYYRNKKKGQPMKEGTISRDGVVCCCCKTVFTLSKFEAHAGSTNHRPSANMFLEDGRSIQECLNREKKVEIPKREKKKHADNKSLSDSTCSACNLEGEIILCDQCPSAFHPKCLGLEEQDIPEGKWFCPSCCCRICNLVSKENSYLQCAQCEHRYHIECLISKGIIQPEYQRVENWCCGSRCERVHSGLRKLLGKPNPVGDDNLAWTLLKCIPENALNNKKLNSALRVIQECFAPVIEARDGRNVVKDVIFNRWSDLPRLNFQGFYTMVLGKKDNFCTAVLVRVHGDKVAEIPFVATRVRSQRKGMCRILMNELEKKLMELGVEKIVLPATEKMLDTWENKFGYPRMNEAERLEFVGCCTLLGFHDCIMCQKILKKAPSPDFRGEEHVYDHFDKNTISEVFDDASQSFERDLDQSDAFKPNKRRKL